MESVTNDQRPRLQVKLERLAEVIDQIQAEHTEIDRATNRLYCQPPNIQEVKNTPTEGEGFITDLDYQINKLQRLKIAMSETRESLIKII